MDASFTTVVVAFVLVVSACEALVIFIQKMLSGFSDAG